MSWLNKAKSAVLKDEAPRTRCVFANMQGTSPFQARREVRGVFTWRNFPCFLMLATNAPRNGLVPGSRRTGAGHSRGEIPMMEGDSVTLNSDLTEIMDDDRIQWMFFNTLIAEINKWVNRFTVHDDVLDGRFRDRLKLNKQTGSLTITNTTTEHVGVYGVRINHMSMFFFLTVYARLPVPVISSNYSQCSSSSSLSSQQTCSLVCLAVNVSDVTLSWYKGNSLLSSISVSDLSISLSLPLEIERVNDSYSCVVAYSFTNQTTHLNTELCHTCSDSVHCCGSTEAVIRLVLSALVGVATVILLVYDIRSRRAEQDQAHVHTSGGSFPLQKMI
ncbi:uncharacterized protein LOC127158643 [Labeo rohita]|uniref:uncharacterized protein LOC127158643 n=1 Tax=Labeo rohita TaxID=84645 RepID=UPI0021E22538|nr:uncharacterized protein LOC127158643 [Labeo rohita]